MKLGEVLVKEGLITPQQLSLVLERQVQSGGRLGTNMLELRMLNEDEFTKFLSKYCQGTRGDSREDRVYI